MVWKVGFFLYVYCEKIVLWVLSYPRLYYQPQNVMNYVLKQHVYSYITYAIIRSVQNVFSGKTILTNFYTSLIVMNISPQLLVSAMSVLCHCEMLRVYYLRLTILLKEPLIRIPMATESGTLGQIKCIRPCLDLNLRPHERGWAISVNPLLYILLTTLLIVQLGFL